MSEFPSIILIQPESTLPVKNDQLVWALCTFDHTILDSKGYHYKLKFKELFFSLAAAYAIQWDINQLLSGDSGCGIWIFENLFEVWNLSRAKKIFLWEALEALNALDLMLIIKIESHFCDYDTEYHPDYKDISELTDEHIEPVRIQKWKVDDFIKILKTYMAK